MLKSFITAAMLLVASISAADGLYNKVYEIKSFRYGDHVARYVMQYGEACLSVEILSPKKNWQITSSRKFCDVDGVVFATGFSDVEFKNLAFSDDGLHFDLWIAPLLTGADQVRTCFIGTKEGNVLDLKCAKSVIE